MVLFCFILSGCSTASRIVGSGAPKCAGSNSCSSMYSPCQIFSAIFAVMGGDTGPTEIVDFDCGFSGSNDANVVASESCWATPEPNVVVLKLPILLPGFSHYSSVHIIAPHTITIRTPKLSISFYRFQTWERKHATEDYGPSFLSQVWNLCHCSQPVNTRGPQISSTIPGDAYFIFDTNKLCFHDAPAYRCSTQTCSLIPHFYSLPNQSCLLVCKIIHPCYNTPSSLKLLH